MKKKRIRVRTAAEGTAKHAGWILDVFPSGGDKGGRYDMMRPGAIIEVLMEHNRRRPKAMSLPTEEEIMRMGKQLRQRGWKVERTEIDIIAFYRRIARQMPTIRT